MSQATKNNPALPVDAGLMSENDGLQELSPQEYDLLRTLVYEKCGINLGAQKQQLVRARLGRRLRQLQLKSYRDYYEYARRDQTGEEIVELIDAISTNTTHLFRENQHFEFVRKVVGEWAADRSWRDRNSELRFWSAGCSSGEEPYSLAMTLDDTLTGTRVGFRILATDISTRVLDSARRGLYEAHRLGSVPEALRRRYFVPADGDRNKMQVHPDLRKRITFAHFNLMSERFPFRQKFHTIFCRNVMIYFDRPTQEALVSRYSAHLQPGGYLLIGHSESLNSIKHDLQYVAPTIYRKP